MLERTYRVSKKDKGPLLEFLLDALRQSGCSIIQASPPTSAPFQIAFETPFGERLGIIAYAFLANAKQTLHRPVDEYRFQMKYGSKDGRLHHLWQDPFGLYTTLLLGVAPDEGFIVGADSIHNSPTRLFISKFFKESHVAEVLRSGWHAWEREQRSTTHTEPVEVLVGVTPKHFLRYIYFEREARGEDQGHRHFLAEKVGDESHMPALQTLAPYDFDTLAAARLHALEREFQLTPQKILTLINDAPRLKMAVRGWVAEHHLLHLFASLPSVARCLTIPGDGRPDLEVRLQDGRTVLVECKNVLRKANAAGHARVDFMRTRAAQANPCSRYYGPGDFQLLAACMHAQTEKWEFRFRPTAELAPHPTCVGRLSNRVAVDTAWLVDPVEALQRAA